MADALMTTDKPYTVLVKIIPDEEGRAPWEQGDGHGIVSDWTDREKNPGELVLSSDRNSRRYYDVDASMVIALRDNWGVSVAESVNLTDKQIAEKAVGADYEYLRSWCNGEWRYVGVLVEILVHEITIVSASLWGIESNAESYISEITAELTIEALTGSSEMLAKLQTVVLPV